MKRLLFVATILLLSAAPDSRTPYQKALPSCVLIECAEGTGSGVFVTDHLVLTAAHVGADARRARLPDGTTMPAVLVRSDPVRDLALLRVEGKGTPLPLGDEPLRGDELMVIGCSTPFGFNAGHCRAVYHHEYPILNGDVSARMLDVSIPVNPGDSGAPVVCHGKLSGVVVSMDQFKNQCNYAVSITEIRSFLDE